MTFYEKVLEEYKISDCSYYALCLCSKTFDDVWPNYKIKEHAEKFLKQTNNDYFIIGSNVLFLKLSFDIDFLQDKQIRLDFLEWCIQNNLDL